VVVVVELIQVVVQDQEVLVEQVEQVRIQVVQEIQQEQQIVEVVVVEAL
jgi:hypothetical protein